MNRQPTAATAESVFARWAFGAAAAAVALFMLVYYVQLLQDSVARGAQWRYSQATASPVATTHGGAKVPSAQVRLVSTAR